jgi:hypothetical protein
MKQPCNEEGIIFEAALDDGGSLALEINNGKEEKTAPGRYQLQEI